MKSSGGHAPCAFPFRWHEAARCGHLGGEDAESQEGRSLGLQTPAWRTATPVWIGSFDGIESLRSGDLSISLIYQFQGESHWLESGTWHWPG